MFYFTVCNSVAVNHWLSAIPTQHPYKKGIQQQAKLLCLWIYNAQTLSFQNDPADVIGCHHSLTTHGMFLSLVITAPKLGENPCHRRPWTNGYEQVQQELKPPHCVSQPKQWHTVGMILKTGSIIQREKMTEFAKTLSVVMCSFSSYQYECSSHSW